LAVQILGDDLDLLHAKAREVEAVLARIEGAADVSVEQRTGQPVLRVEVDREAAARFGVDAATLLDVVAAVGTRRVGEILEGEGRYPIAVRLDEPWRSDPARLAEVPVRTPAGGTVPLGRLVTFHEGVGPSTVERAFGRRRVVVQANVRGRDR